MKHHFLRYVAPAILLLAPCSAIAGEPTFQQGSPVDIESLSTVEWIQGEGPKAFEPGKLYLFECWATWCCGCVANIPHVNELHRKFHDKGLFVYGMDVWENDKERAVKFVRMKGEGMSYPVGYVGRKSAFDQNWLQAAGQRSIPHAFLVKDGKLALSCDPRRLTEDVVTALLDPSRFEATVEKIARSANPAERLANARIDFDRAKARKDIAGMEEALVACERAKPGDPLIVKLKLDRCFAQQDWKGAIQLIHDIPQGGARDSLLRNLAERLASQPATADAFPGEFTNAFLPVYAQSLKSPAAAAGATHYVSLAMLQWRAGSQEDASASAAQAVVLAKEAQGADATIAPFEKFDAALKSGTLPTMGEFRRWEREAR